MPPELIPFDPELAKPVDDSIKLNGVINLLGTDFILDFKTDRAIQPTHHRFQLWAYATATQ